MTNIEKLASKKRNFIFFREGGFYSLVIPEATVEDNAKYNPGTLRVEDAVTGSIVWEANPHRGSEFCGVCYGQRMIPSDDPDGDVMNTPCPACNEWHRPLSSQNK